MAKKYYEAGLDKKTGESLRNKTDIKADATKAAKLTDEGKVKLGPVRSKPLSERESYSADRHHED